MIIIAVLLILGLIALGIAVKKKGKHEPDYRTFFVMGIIWLGFGIPMMIQNKGNSALFIMGLVFTAVGLVNKDKWKKPEPIKGQKKILMLAFTVGLALLVFLTGIYVYLKSA